MKRFRDLLSRIGFRSAKAPLLRLGSSLHVGCRAHARATPDARWLCYHGCQPATMGDLAKDYVSVSQAAKIRGVSRQAILKALARGRLKGSQVDSFWLIHRRDLAGFEPKLHGQRRKAKRKRTNRYTYQHRGSVRSHIATNRWIYPSPVLEPLPGE